LRWASKSGALDVAEAVGLDQVAQLGVDDQAAGDQVGLEGQVLDGPAVGQQALLDVLVGAQLPFLDLVVDQGVVHVVTDGAQGAHVQGAVAEDIPRLRGTFLKDVEPAHRLDFSSGRRGAETLPRRLPARRRPCAPEKKTDDHRPA
jgi:hypothetical protein